MPALAREARKGQNVDNETGTQTPTEGGQRYDRESSSTFPPSVITSLPRVLSSLIPWSSREDIGNISLCCAVGLLLWSLQLSTATVDGNAG